MASSIQTEFQQILTAAKERRGDLSVDSMIVSSHLAQMRMFILRRGLEFYAEQDSYGKRREFIAQVCEHNMLDMKLDSIIDYFLCDGQGLFYFRPTGDDYQLLFFPKDSYRAYRDQNNNIDSVVLVYSFAVKEPSALDAFAQTNKRGGKKKFIRLKVYKDRIEQTISSEKIEFEDVAGVMPMNMPGQTETLVNSLGFIPAVEVFNHMDCTGEATGNGEFDWLAHQIIYHDELTRNIRKNLKFFGNPTLVSSRPRHDLIESGDENSFKPTISSQAGFAPMTGGSMHSTRVSQPFGTGSDGQIKVPRVIANLEPTDRVQYMTPDSVSGDQNLYVKNYRSEIRLALGGVDDLDINLASTAYEIKTLYGRVAATAEKKAKAMFDYGLCQLFSMMISHEESMFKDSFAVSIGLKKPAHPLPEEYQEDPDGFKAAYEKYQKQIATFEKKRDENIRATLESGEMPIGVVGLVPDGSTKVSWRWTGQVFEDSPDDVLQHSIVVRNLQELGVDSIEALKYLFPDKTDEERAAMLSGYPFRMVQQTQQSLNSFIGLLGSLYQLPHPQTPEMPLASDPNLDITGFLYRSLEFLRKELSYSGSYKPADTGPSVSALSDADQRRATLGLPVRDEPTINLAGISSTPGTNTPAASGLPAGSGPAGFGSSGQSLAGGVPGAQRKFEYKQPLPSPGSVLGLPDTDATGAATSKLGFNSPSNVGQFGAADLQSPSFNPSYTAQAPMQGQPQEAVSDAYLSQISDASLEVLEHFGAEAPVLLNQYACAVEDALVEQVQRVQSHALLLEAAGEERAAMNLMLTDPDVLADYVNDFYGPNGPYPTPTQEEAYYMEQQAARDQFEQEILAQQQGGVPVNFQRPEMEMPTPGRQVNPANDFWGGFGQMMDNNPENAWKYLAQAPQGALQAKMLVQEG